MANLALIASTAVKLQYPEAVVVERGRGYIKHRIADAPDGRRRFVLDTQVGGVGWHYGPAFDQEVDTAWEPGVAPWDYQMVKAEFNARALSRLNAGQVIEYRDPNSDQYVRFQPMALQYSNALNQISQISMPQAVDAQVADDTLTWVNGYGPGRTLVWEAQTARLHKELHLAAGSLPTVPQFIRDGGSPVLELNFIFAYSPGITPWINGTPWTGGQQDRDTQGLVEFKDATGNILWWFNLPRSWDSSGTEQLGVFRFKKQGNSLYVSHRVHLSWIEDAARVWPVKVDTTIDKQVGASSDDVYYGSLGWDLSSVQFDIQRGAWGYLKMGAIFLGIIIPDVATLTVAYMTLTCNQWGPYSSANANADFYAFDQANPATFSTAADFDSRPLTTAVVAWDSIGNWVVDGEYQTPSLVPIFTELLASYSYAGGAAVGFLVDSFRSVSPTQRGARSYDNSTTKAPKLHIEYTAGGVTVTPAAATCVATSVAPTVIMGSLSLTPSPATVIATSLAPSVVLGSLTVAPAAASVVGAKVDPDVVLGSLTLTPTAASIVAAVVNPTVVHGSIVVTPAAASAIGANVAPDVIMGSMAITPAAASVVGVNVNPTISISGPGVASVGNLLLKRVGP